MMEMTASGKTDPGLRKEKNEDAFLLEADYLIAVIVAFILFLPGCRPKVPPAAVPLPARPQARVSKTRYSVQVGAFSVLKNAVRLTESLKSRGLDAYYFRHESGLYKVRLGDFDTREAALDRAERLLGEGTIDTYYIVGPEDYALARSRIYGGTLLREEIVKTAERFIGLPYQWGGSSPEEGFDCSGLTMAVYQLNGLNLPRSSAGQFRAGRAVPRKALAKGDLVFFAIKDGKKISHVGVYAGNGSFIHAPGKGKTIRKDALSNVYFKKRYKGARCYI